MVKLSAIKLLLNKFKTGSKYMEKSIYNFIIKVGEDDLIYNSFSNRLLKVQDRIINFLKSSQDLNIKPNFDLISRSEYDSLVKNGVLCEKREIQKQKVLRHIHTGIQYRIGSKSIILEIHPNSDCNFNCFYCYEKRTSKQRHLSMTDKTLQSIYKYIETRLKAGCRNVSIGWCGGEPLLETDIIIKGQYEITKLVNKYGAIPKSHLVTNGILLTPTTSNDLVNAGIQTTQITIDGPEFIHNKRRKYLTKYDQNYSNIIHNIIHSNDSLKIQIRINIDMNNKDYIYDLLDELVYKKIWPYKSNVLKRIDLSPVNSNLYFQNQHQISPIELCIIRHRFRKRLYEKYIEITQNTKAKIDFQFPNSNEICSNIGYPSGWVVDVNGKLLKCSEHVGNANLYITDIEDISEDINKEQEIFLDLQPYTEPNLQTWGCLDCKVLPVCRKRCAWEYQNPEGINRRCCDAKDTLEADIKFQYEFYQNHQNYFSEIPNLETLK